MFDCALFNFVVWGVIGSALCAFGYVGNLLSVFALQRDVRTPTTTLLQSLAVSDLVLLLSVCITDAVPYICAYTRDCADPWKVWPSIRYIWVLTPVSHMCSIWLVVLISGNRYWAVCRPHSTGVVWTNRRTWVYVFCVVLLVVAFNMPRFFEYAFVQEYRCRTDQRVLIYRENNGPAAAQALASTGGEIVSLWKLHNTNNQSGLEELYLEEYRLNTSACVKRTQEITSEFGSVHSYRVIYKVMLVNVLLVLLPLAFLFVSSIWIVRTLRLSHRMSAAKKRSMSASLSSRSSSHHHHHHNVTTAMNGAAAATCAATAAAADPATTASAARRSRVESLRPGEIPMSFNSRRTTPSREVTFLLVTVVLVAVFCQTPLAVFHFVRYAYTYQCGDTVFYLESFSKFLVNLNSCVNFVIYCLLSPKFRRMLKDALTCRERRARNRRASAAAVVGPVSRIQFEFSVRESIKRRKT